jgi:hypothetical protein
MVTLLRRLGIGFIYGVGFALGVAGVLALTIVGGAGFLTSTTGRSVSFPSYGPSESRSRPDQFAISDTSAVKNAWGGLNILGTIHNGGADTPRYVNVYADLFDKNGKFIYQCMQQFNEGLRKDQKSNFMIECHSMPKELLPSFESFKIHARAL